MTELWTADIDVTVELARAAIGEQFPELVDITVEPLGEGWDNAAFLAGGEYVFRFPRRAVAAPLMAREIAILPMLAPLLPLAVSAPQFIGTPTATYPWPFAGYRAFGGKAVSALTLDWSAHRALAAELGAFLRALHGLDPAPALAGGLSEDDIGRLNHSTRMVKLDVRVKELVKARLIADPRPLFAFLESVTPSGPRQNRLTVVHGDLYAKHVIVDGTGKVQGIIDWGDLHYGDPAIDLSIVFEILPPSARETLASAYGEIDEQTWRLARYRAIYHAALVAHYGFRIRDEETLRAGLTGLTYATS